MSDKRDTRVRGARDPKPEETLETESTDKATQRDQGSSGNKKPVFRFARLDGRDTLKYEDTADK